MARANRRGIDTLAAVIALGGLLGCQHHASTQSSSSPLSSTLTREVDFPHGILVPDPLPDTTDTTATILPLGPTVVMHPGDASIMALEVDDPSDRPVAATLIQFGNEPSHIKVPTQEGQGSKVVLENDFTVGKNLCKSLCNAIFSVEVTEKVELSDGKISSSTKREIVVDCRKQGDPMACKAGKSDAGAGTNGSKLLCGDVTQGEIALSGDPILDAHLDSVRQLSKAIGKTESEVKSTFASIAVGLGLDPGSNATDITNALATRIDQLTQMGLTLLLGQPGCAVRLEQVSLALRVCDPDGVASLDALQCAGVCEPTSDASACSAAPSSGCHGSLASQKCTGSCVGACEVTLTEPTMCVGTCLGTCSGQCPDDGKGGCAGPCDGMCSGKCRKVSGATCNGDCTGRCDEVASGTPSCTKPLNAYCAPPMDGALTCPGDCFGGVRVDKGSMACRASAIGIARSYPRCEPPQVQLSFAFKPDAPMSDQSKFAKLVHDLDASLVRLYDALGRIALLSAADADLSAAATGEIADELTSGLSASPKDSGLGCAGRRLTEITDWLDTEKTKLDGLQSDITQLLKPISVMK